MSTRPQAGGKAVQFSPKRWKDIFFWDVYKQNEVLLTAGYDSEGDVLLANDFDHTTRRLGRTS